MNVERASERAKIFRRSNPLEMCPGFDWKKLVGM